MIEQRKDWASTVGQTKVACHPEFPVNLMAIMAIGLIGNAGLFLVAHNVVH